MTVNELLALLGRAWPRLLIYPGGLVAFALVWLLVRAQNTEHRTNLPTTNPSPPRLPSLSPFGRLRSRGRAGDRPPTTDDGHAQQPVTPFQFFILNSSFSIPGSLLDLSAVVAPWLGLALLPLPHAAAIGRQIDLIAGLALLEWPLLLTIAAERHDCDVEAHKRARTRLGAMLNGYPPLILATLVLVSAAGSLDLAALARAPVQETPARVALLHWLGAAAWLLALPPALGLGAFAGHAPSTGALRAGLGLRTVGLVAIAALPWFPLVVTSDENASVTADARWLLLPLPPLVIAGLLWGFARLTAGRSARPWARAYLALDGALLLVLLWAAYTALQARLA